MALASAAKTYHDAPKQALKARVWNPESVLNVNAAAIAKGVNFLLLALSTAERVAPRLQKPEPALRPMDNQSDSDKRRVLIVEDDEATSYALRTRLGREGIDADIAPNGFDAIQFITERPYDAILLDLITPGPMNGFSVLSYLEAEHPQLVDRLFITSGMPEQTIAHAAPQLLPRYYRKPYDIDVVIGAVQKAIRRVEPVTDNTRVLIADDDGDIRLLVSTIARMLGRESVQAADGLDAIRQLASEQFAGAVVDLVMPNVDGFGVLRYLREENPEMLAKTVVLTGMPDRYRSRALLDDICALIEKPATPEKIRAALAQCLALPETA